LLMVMEDAKGLFQKAITQSGAIGFDIEVFKSESKRGSIEFLKELGVKSEDLPSIQNLNLETILKTCEKICSKARSSGKRIPFNPVIDGKYIKELPINSMRSGYSKDISLLTGSNKDEMRLFSVINPNFGKLTEEMMNKSFLTTIKAFGQSEEYTEKFINIYKELIKNRFDETPQNIIDAFNTDLVFRIPKILLMEALLSHQPKIYNYIFTWESPLGSPAVAGKLGASHALEIPFVFGTYKNPQIGLFSGTGVEADKLSKKIIDTWISFAKNGVPRSDSIPEWPSYRLDQRSTMLIGKEWNIVGDPMKDARLLWMDFLKIG